MPWIVPLGDEIESCGGSSLCHFLFFPCLFPTDAKSRGRQTWGNGLVNPTEWFTMSLLNISVNSLRIWTQLGWHDTQFALWNSFCMLMFLSTCASLQLISLPLLDIHTHMLHSGLCVLYVEWNWYEMNWKKQKNAIVSSTLGHELNAAGLWLLCYL